jgi:Ser/Thr protein kinase RdoA (MazF antagonist)
VKDILNVAKNFTLDGEIESIRAHGNGNVNDTYLVTLAEGEGHAILQRVNTYVFSAPEVVMDNMHKATQHLSACVAQDGLDWQVQQVIPAVGGQAYWEERDGTFWRMISFIENSESFDTVYTHKQAYELGYALGMFHQHINRLPADTFRTVIEGFHVSPGYLKAFDKAKNSGAERLDDELDYALEFIEKHRKIIPLLEEAKSSGILPLRTIHGDPKANNVMFDKLSGKAISMIDLDTIQPGLVHYDIGDSIRSSCNPLGEEPGVEWRETTFDVESFQHLLKGYLVWGKSFLAESEYDYIYEAIFLMAFELGLRFLTDYLRGDLYYKVHFPTQNKYRALTQFRLAGEIQKNRTKIIKIIKELQPL